MRTIRVIGLFLFICLGLGTASAQSALKRVSFDFKTINVAQAIQLIYAEVLTSPYVLDPEVLTDVRQVSFRYSSDKGDVKAFVRTFLQSLGYLVHIKEGIDFISKQPLAEKREVIVEKEGFVYRPQFRDVSYLSRLLSPIFQGAFSVNRSIAGSSVQSDKPVPDGSATSLIDQNADVLIFTGTDNEISKLKKLLPQVDFQLGEVVVRGVVYEVNTSSKDGSAFGLLASLLSGKMQLGLAS
jgi:general secretion pathway protein D